MTPAGQAPRRAQPPATPEMGSPRLRFILNETILQPTKLDFDFIGPRGKG